MLHRRNSTNKIEKESPRRVESRVRYYKVGHCVHESTPHEYLHLSHVLCILRCQGGDSKKKRGFVVSKKKKAKMAQRRAQKVVRKRNKKKKGKRHVR